MLRRFHIMKEPRESDARQQLKRELFAFNKVDTLLYLLTYLLTYSVVVLADSCCRFLREGQADPAAAGPII